MQSDLDVELAVEQMYTKPSIRELAVRMNELLDGSPFIDNEKAITQTDHQKGEWLVCPKPRPDASIRLIVFFVQVVVRPRSQTRGDLLPESIELQILQLPGREERLGEPLITDMKELV